MRTESVNSKLEDFPRRLYTLYEESSRIGIILSMDRIKWMWHAIKNSLIHGKILKYCDIPLIEIGLFDTLVLEPNRDVHEQDQ